MTSPRSISEKLPSAVALLDEAARGIVELPLEPSRDHVARIGEALSSIFEIQYHLNAIDPSLTPPELKGPFEHPDGALAVALAHAQAAEAKGHVAVAIALLEWLASQVGSPVHADRAKAEIERLKRRDD